MHDITELVRQIHLNARRVFFFAYGGPRVSQLLRERTAGDVKSIRRSLFEDAEVEADQALATMAMALRALDDIEKIGAHLQRSAWPPFGKVLQSEGEETELHFRDLTNKMLHARKFEWTFDSPDDPKIVCLPHDHERWISARIDVWRLLMLVAQIAG